MDVKGEDDRRMKYIILTEKGKKLEPVINDISKRLIKNLYAGITDDEKKALVDILERIQKNW